MRHPTCLLPAVFFCLAVHSTTTPLVTWTFDGSTTSTDGQYAGQNTAVGFVAGHTGAATDQAVEFNGTNSQVRYAAGSLWTFNQDQSFTIDFYIKTTQAPSVVATPVMCRPGSNTDWSFVLGGDYAGDDRATGHLCFELWNWQADRVPTKRPINDGVWHRVVAAYYAPSQVGAMLLDGELQGVMLVGGSYGAGDAMLNLGNNIGANQPFAGQVDQFTISSGVPDGLLDQLGFDERILTLPKTTVEDNYTQWLARMVEIKPWVPADVPTFEARKQAIRHHILDGLGLVPFPYTQNTPGDLLPLDVHYGTLVDYPDYTLQGLRIQTWKDVYAYGFLYLPKTGAPPYPTILNPNGHFPNESRDEVIQSRCIGLARKGCIALSINSVHPIDERVNLMPQSGMLWDNLRAIDYLLTRPDVDPARLGSTGASGGSQQTFYMMAVDDRLDAAMPVVMPSYFKEIMVVKSGLHHFCNWVPGLMRLVDCPEICATFAPKPCTYISTSQDWTHNWPTQGMPEVTATYGLYGATDQVADFHDNLPHDYMRSRRETMYAFFLRVFMGITDATAAIEPDDLAILSNAEMLALLPNVVNAKDMNTELPQEFAARLTPPDPAPPQSPAEASAYLQPRREALRELIDAPIPADFSPSVSTATAFVEGDVNFEILHFRSEPEITVPALLVTLLNSTGPFPLVVMLGGQAKGSTYIGESGLCQSLLAEGCALLLPDVRYNGEMSSNSEWYRNYGTHLGRFEASLGAQDLMQMLAAIRDDSRFVPGRTVIVGLGNGAIPGLLASILDQDVAGFAGSDVGQTYGEGRTRPYFNGVVTLGDLPQLALLMLGRPFLWRGVSDQNRYAFLHEFASALSATMEISSGADGPGRREILDWYHNLFAPAPTNQPPVWFAPQAILLAAGSGVHDHLLDLARCVTDDDTPADELQFAVVSQSAPAIANLTLVSGVLSATVSQTTGMSTVVVSARDRLGNESDTTIQIIVGGATGLRLRDWERLR